MEAAWIPVVGTLLGVVVGGSITFGVKWLELRYARKGEKKRLRIERLEEFYEALSDFADNRTDYARKVAFLGESPIDRTTLETLDSMMTSTVRSNSRIGALVSIYAPDTLAEWNALQEVNLELMAAGNKLSSGKPASAEIEKLAPKFAQAYVNLSTKVIKILEKEVE